MALCHQIMSILHDSKAAHERKPRRRSVVHGGHGAYGTFAVKVLCKRDVTTTHQDPSSRPLRTHRATSTTDSRRRVVDIGVRVVVRLRVRVGVWLVVRARARVGVRVGVWIRTRVGIRLGLRLRIDAVISIAPSRMPSAVPQSMRQMLPPRRLL